MNEGRGVDVSKTLCSIGSCYCRIEERRGSMTLWKVNEKHLNCVITQAEIREMGFELSQLQESKEQMSLFLGMILENGKKLFDLDTGQGIQRFQLTLMQNQSIFLSISCEGAEEEINHSLEQQEEVVEKKEVSFLYNVKFPSLERAIEFCHYYPTDKQITSSLFKHRKEYYLTVDFNKEFSEVELTNFILRIGEFEGKFDTNPFLRSVMQEHGSCMIQSDAMNALKRI